MSEIKIDEDFIKTVTNHTIEAVSVLIELTETIKNKDEDIGVRYIAFSKLYAFNPFFKGFFQMFQSGLAMGFDLSHERLNTEKTKKGLWGNIELETNPFFGGATTKEIVINPDKLTDEVKELLKKVFSE